MTVAVKCNIAEKVLAKRKQGIWGFAFDLPLTKSIVENYLEHLACEGFSLKPCADSESPCAETTGVTIVNCNINLTGISFQLTTGEDPYDISFLLGVGDIYGAKQPISYQWIYNTDTFELVGEDNQPSLTLRVKEGKKVDLIVSPIQLQITDANGCIDTKQCYYTPDGMKCNNNFQPCFPPASLSVQFNYTACVKPLALQVTPFSTTNSGVLLTMSDKSVWYYKPDTEELITMIPPLTAMSNPSGDIAHIKTKFWLNGYQMSGGTGGVSFHQYILNKDGSASFEKYIETDSSQNNAIGFTAIDENNIVSVVEYVIDIPNNTWQTKVLRWNISTSPAVKTDLFSLPLNRLVSGDIVYNSDTGRYIISSHTRGNTTENFITEYEADGTVVAEINHSYPNIWGLYHYDNELYAVSSNGQIYLVKLSGLTLVKALSLGGKTIYGASQIPEYSKQILQ